MENKINKIEYSTLLIKPDLFREGAVPCIRQVIIAHDLEIIGEHPQFIDRDQARIMYEGTKGIFGEMIYYMSSGLSYVFIVRGLDVIEIANCLKGKTKLGGRKASGLRAVFSKNPLVNGIHTPSDLKEVRNDFDIFLQDDVYELLNFTQLRDEFYRFINEK